MFVLNKTRRRFSLSSYLLFLLEEFFFLFSLQLLSFWP